MTTPEPLTLPDEIKWRGQAALDAHGYRWADADVQRIFATMDARAADPSGLRAASEGVMAAYDRTGWPDDDAMRALRAALAAQPTPTLDITDSNAEVRRLLGYLWTATGKNHPRPVCDLFAAYDPIVADVERFAIFPETRLAARGLL